MKILIIHVLLWWPLKQNDLDFVFMQSKIDVGPMWTEIKFGSKYRCKIQLDNYFSIGGRRIDR
jgi:hypothetical protein